MRGIKCALYFLALGGDDRFDILFAITKPVQIVGNQMAYCAMGAFNKDDPLFVCMSTQRF